MQLRKWSMRLFAGVGVSVAILCNTAVAAELTDYSMPFCKSMVVHRGLSTPLPISQKTDFEWYLNERAKIFTQIWQSELKYGIINKKIFDAQQVVMNERKSFLLSEPPIKQITAVQREELELLCQTIETEANATEQAKVQKKMLVQAVEYGLMNANEAKYRMLILKEEHKFRQAQLKQKPEGMAYRELDDQQKLIIGNLDERLRLLNKLYLEKRLKGKNINYQQRAEVMRELDNYGMDVLKRLTDHNNQVSKGSIEHGPVVQKHNEQICF